MTAGGHSRVDSAIRTPHLPCFSPTSSIRSPGGNGACSGLIPPAIIALYFLKLRRQPLSVPSTYLWSRAIEDLHVNSLWQRLRQSLLLFLQLLLIGLLAFTLLRPGWKGTELLGKRFIFLIDTSASMAATDTAPTRLDEAKRQAIALIEQMKPENAAMIISFSERGQGRAAVHEQPPAAQARRSS